MQEQNSKDMKKIMLLLALCAMFIGCEDEGIDYTSFPICGHKYREAEEYAYHYYEFYGNGRCYRSLLNDLGHHILPVDRYYYYMVGDSIFLYRTYSIDEPTGGYIHLRPTDRGCYHGDYIVIGDEKAYMVK